uniref:Uncharacterized protein n=1 Tax=Salarias fasciatus TaxID=181472 RepID=A0A672HPN0_SALFA
GVSQEILSLLVSICTERLDLPERPSSVEELRDILADKFKLAPDFSLTFDDPEFDNEPCNLSDIQYLPEGKAVLRVDWKIVLTPVPIDSSFAGDTDISSDMASTPSSVASSQGRRSSRFPAIFTVPTFSYTLELKLKNGGAAYSESNALMSYTREMKSEILAKLAEVIYAYESYPVLEDLEKVAKALVEKHPCIGNAGPDKPWKVWTVSLKNKMNNYRATLSRAGCTEVRVNKRRRGAEDGVKLKRPRRAELNFLPNHPDGVGVGALESERAWLEDELKKRNINKAEVNAKMDRTFSLRRKEVVAEDVHVSTIRQRWPALFMLDQVHAEFKRVTGKELMETFFTSLDGHTRGLIRVYRTIAHHPSQGTLRNLLEYLDEQVRWKITDKCPDSMSEASSPMPMGILEVVGPPGGPEAAQRAAVVVDGEILCDNLPDPPTALAVLFGFIYALNIAYPPQWSNFFEVIQKLIMSMDVEKSGKHDKLNKLRTKLSQL